MSSLDEFPSAFKAYLEDFLIIELRTNNFYYIPIYYSKKPEQLRYDDFNKNEWLLSDDIDMTLNDVDIMKKYKINFLNFIKKCENILLYFQNKENCQYKYIKIKTEVDRMTKIMNINYYNTIMDIFNEY
jgi:hypothetical protein